jgi:hypothetical protein
MNENIAPAVIKRYKIVIGILAAIILVLAVLLTINKTRVHTFVVEKENAVAESLHLQKQLDSLINEHEKMKKEYGNMNEELTKRDSIIQANASEIQRLIAASAGKNQIQRKLDYLRGITQDYVVQIDKLLKENAELKTEIAGITDDYNKEKEHAASLSKDKDDLSQQINKAAILTAYNITAQAIRLKSGDKEEVVDKAKKTEKIKISFTIGKNPLVQSGPRAIYIRIAKPDNTIIHDGQSFEFNKQQIMYTFKHSIDYQQKPVPVTLYYDKSDRVVPGTLHIAIFVDGQEIGQTQLTLK